MARARITPHMAVLSWFQTKPDAMAALRLDIGSVRLTAVILGLSSLLTVTWGLVLERPIIEGPHVSLVNTFERFGCSVPNAPNTEDILYELYLENAENVTKTFGESTGPQGSGTNFNILANVHHDGNYFCKASVQNRSTIPATFSNAHYFKVIEPVEGAELVSNPPLAEVFEGRGLTLTCAVRKGTHVSYRWFHNGAPSQNKVTGNHLYVAQASQEDAGNYSCLATNQLNDTHVYDSESNQTFIRVKVPVSKPEISLMVLKEQGVVSTHAHVTCRSLAGTPPLNFTFTLRSGTQEHHIVLQEYALSASITLPIALNRNEGQVLCHTSNGLLPLASDTLDLEVVPVGGAVTLTAKQVRRYLKVEALALHCGVERGTFPRFRWFLNDTNLESQNGHFGHTLHLPSITARSSGFYHCVVADSFDEMNSISSEKLFIDEKALEYVSMAVVSVVLGCFLFLVCLVTFCCVYGAINRRRLLPEKPRPAFVSLETDNLETEDEEPVEGEYMEDVELVRAANINYTEKSEEDSVESVDEWPEIERALQISCMDETVPPS